MSTKINLGYKEALSILYNEQIGEQSKEVQEHIAGLVAEKEPELLSLIPDLSLEHQKLMVSRLPTYIKHIPSPCDEVKLLAIKGAPALIRKFRDATREMWDYAVVADTNMMFYYPFEDNHDIWLEVLKKSPERVAWITEPTLEQQKLALEGGKEALMFICGLKPELYKEAISICPHTTLPMIKQWDISSWAFYKKNFKDVELPVDYTEEDVLSAVLDGELDKDEVPTEMFTPCMIKALHAVDDEPEEILI